MVKEVYLDGIELEERLSNKVYLYAQDFEKAHNCYLTYFED